MAMRHEMWNRLAGTFDILVIGGGITGAGIARDAARRGLSVALVEQNDLASGTSSRSSKLVHGGLRYLEMGEFSLVFEAVSERRVLMDIAPHLVQPLGFLFPVYKGSRRSRWVINAGMWIYDGLSLFRSPKLHRNLNAADVLEEEPALNQEDLDGAPLFYDCQTDDARLTLETALDAIQAGAVVCTYAKVTGLIHDETGRAVGVSVGDVASGAQVEVRANTIVNATGPWTDHIRAMGEGGATPLLRPTKGVHIVVDHEKLPIRHAVVCFHPVDGRVLFAIPWGDRSYIGTTDTDYQGDPALVAADAEDVRYLLDATRAYFPTYPLQPSDVISTWAGLRPLIAPEGSSVGESQVSREHLILVGPEGVITIAGGKLTTYRRMAAEVVDTAVRLLTLSNKVPSKLKNSDTGRHPLPGGVDWPEDDDVEKVVARIAEAADGRLDTATCRLLAFTYGMRGVVVAERVRANPALAAPLVAGRNEVLAQVDWSVEQELAVSIADVLIRRTQLYFKDFGQGLGAASVVAVRLGEILGWDAARVEAEVEAYRAEVALTRNWRV